MQPGPLGFAFHFVGIVLLNYVFVKLLHKKKSKLILAAILVIDVSNLFLFKYFYLFLQSLHDVSGLKIFHHQFFNTWLESILGAHSIVLPLAISFYTFQLIAYVVDVYRGQILRESPLIEFMAFILFFPQLIAGPIMRHSDFFYQIDNIKPDQDKMQTGLFLLMLGIIKKVIIADNIMPLITDVYIRPGYYDWFSNLNAASGFVLLIYCDFSGYTDIARGLGKLLGLDLPENFRGPYLSASFREFWQRWHITLSTWMRDYLYIPMGGSRTTPIRNNFITISTIILAGLWHGASYKFLVWGLMHGVTLVIERQIRKIKNKFFPPPDKSDVNPAPPEKVDLLIAALKRTTMVIITYFFTIIIAIPFFSPGLGETWLMIKHIFVLGDGVKSIHNEFLGKMLVVTLFLNYLQTRRTWPAISRKWKYVLLTIFGLFTVFLLGNYSPESQEFIYFQF